MANNSKIEWTDATWNPVTGCVKVSPGCAHCYAERLTLRFNRGGPYLPGKATIEMHHDRLREPLRWRRPRRVFVCSMSDLFHEEVPDDFIGDVFRVMEDARAHTFQVLTKRSQRLGEWHELHGYYQACYRRWPSNVWVGVSVENQYWADRRIPDLLEVNAGVRFLSVEPLLKPVDLTPYLDGIQWVIVGGESGPRARPMSAEWARSIRDQCAGAVVPFFFKQWGGPTSKSGGRLLDGRLHDEYPPARSPGMTTCRRCGCTDEDRRM